jgi:hypothetical protein
MPRILRPLRILVPTLLAALAAAGCESSTLSPESIPGTYVLVSYNGQPLPYEETSLEELRHLILADTFRLDANGTGTETNVTRVDFRNPARTDSETVRVFRFAYEINDDRLRFSYACSNLVNVSATRAANVLPTSCLPGPHAFARIEGDVMLVTTRSAVLRLERID